MRGQDFCLLATFADSFRANRAATEEGRKLVRELRGDEAPVIWHGTNLNDASPEEMEATLGETVLGEFKLRLERLGLEYQTPQRP